MVRAGYKQTEVGEIPEDWDVVPLIQRCKIIDGDRGNNYPSKQDLMDDGHCLFLNAGNVSKTGLVFNKCEYISSERDQTLNNGKLKRNDVVLTTRGTIGNIGYYTKCIPFDHIRINSGMVIIRNEDKTLNSDYLHAILNSPFVNKQVNTLTFGSAQPQLTVKDIKTFIILEGVDPVEQKAIAGALSDLDALIVALEKQIAKKRYIKIATMQQLLTGKKRLPGYGEGKGYKQSELGLIPEDWDFFPLDTQADVIDPHPSHRAPPIVNGGIPFLGIGDLDVNGFIKKEKLRPVSHSIIKEHNTRYNLNEQLIALGRVASIGKVIRLRNDIGHYALSPTMGVIKPKHIDYNYLIYSLLSSATQEQFSKIMSGSTRSSVGMNVLRELQIIKPETHDEAEEIGSVLSSMDKELEALEVKITKTKAIKQGMMQELLTGKTRLI